MGFSEIRLTALCLHRNSITGLCFDQDLQTPPYFNPQVKTLAVIGQGSTRWAAEGLLSLILARLPLRQRALSLNFANNWSRIPLCPLLPKASSNT